MRSQRVRHDWSRAHACTHTHAHTHAHAHTHTHTHTSCSHHQGYLAIRAATPLAEVSLTLLKYEIQKTFPLDFLLAWEWKKSVSLSWLGNKGGEVEFMVFFFKYNDDNDDDEWIKLPVLASREPRLPSLCESFSFHLVDPFSFSIPSIFQKIEGGFKNIFNMISWKIASF